MKLITCNSHGTTLPGVDLSYRTLNVLLNPPSNQRTNSNCNLSPTDGRRYFSVTVTETFNCFLSLEKITVHMCLGKC